MYQPVRYQVVEVGSIWVRVVKVTLPLPLYGTAFGLQSRSPSDQDGPNPHHCFLLPVLSVRVNVRNTYNKISRCTEIILHTYTACVYTRYHCMCRYFNLCSVCTHNLYAHFKCVYVCVNISMLGRSAYCELYAPIFSF